MITSMVDGAPKRNELGGTSQELPAISHYVWSTVPVCPSPQKTHASRACSVTQGDNLKVRYYLHSIYVMYTGVPYKPHKVISENAVHIENITKLIGYLGGLYFLIFTKLQLW